MKRYQWYEKMARVVAPSSSSGTAGRGGSGGGGGIVRSGRVRRNSTDLTYTEGMTVPIDGEDEDNEDSQSIPSLDGHDSDHSCSDSDSCDCEGRSSSDEDGSETEEVHDDDDQKDPPVGSGRRNGKRPATPISSPASLQLQGSYKKARQSQPSSQSEEPSQQLKKTRHPRHVSSLASTDEITTANFYRPTLQAIAPTLAGIQELVHHLRLHHPSLRRHENGGGGGGGGEVALAKVQRSDPRRQTSLIALPTECTYEVTALVSWSKNEAPNKDDDSFRARQLDHRKFSFGVCVCVKQ